MPLRARRVVYSPCGLLVLLECGELLRLLRGEGRRGLVVHGVEGTLSKTHVYLLVDGCVVYACRSREPLEGVEADVEAGEVAAFPPAML